MTEGPGIELFTSHRSLLFTVAYEITGSAADAEDIVQDTYLRWSAADQRQVEHPRAYLVQISTRLALNRLRSLARRREDYVGPWLPEPLLTTPDVAEDAVLADSVSMAMMVVLETLSPDERAVFLLREVFGFDYDEIAAAVSKSQPAVRQLAHRAKAHVQARRPSVAPTQRPPREVVEGFLAAAATGNLQGLMDLMAPDVVLISDGGGKVSAARRPILGPDKAARFLLGTAAKYGQERIGAVPAYVNGRLGVLVTIDQALDMAVTIELSGGLISRLYLVRNPDKLVHTEIPRTLSRG